MRLTMLTIVVLLCASAAYGFTCPEDNHSFYHADVSTGCQVYHLCENGQLRTLTCQSGNAFNHVTSQCEDASTVSCYETMDSHNIHHHHKRSVEEYHTIKIQDVKDKVIELYHTIKPLLTSAVKEVAPSIYFQFEEEYLPFIESVKDEVMPFVVDKVMPHVHKGVEYAKRMAARLIEKAHKSYELSNSTHIAIVSMSDVANDVSNDLKPVIELGRFMTGTLTKRTRSKRSAGMPDLLSGLVEPVVSNILGGITAQFLGQGDTLLSKIIMPTVTDMMLDPETRFICVKAFFSVKSAFSPVILELISRQSYNSPQGMVIKIPRHIFDTAVHRFKTETKPIIRQIFEKHLSAILRRASENVPLIFKTVDNLGYAQKSHIDLLRDDIEKFFKKHGKMYQTSTSSNVHMYTLGEILRDLRNVKVSLFKIALDYIRASPHSWLAAILDEGSGLFNLFMGSETYAKPTPLPAARPAPLPAALPAVLPAFRFAPLPAPSGNRVIARSLNNRRYGK